MPFKNETDFSERQMPGLFPSLLERYASLPTMHGQGWGLIGLLILKFLMGGKLTISYQKYLGLVKSPINPHSKQGYIG